MLTGRRLFGIPPVAPILHGAWVERLRSRAVLRVGPHDELADSEICRVAHPGAPMERSCKRAPWGRVRQDPAGRSERRRVTRDRTRPTPTRRSQVPGRMVGISSAFPPWLLYYTEPGGDAFAAALPFTRDSMMNWFAWRSAGWRSRGPRCSGAASEHHGVGCDRTRQGDPSGAGDS
jgi:hypothetical protein